MKKLSDQQKRHLDKRAAKGQNRWTEPRAKRTQRVQKLRERIERELEALHVDPIS